MSLAIDWFRTGEGEDPLRYLDDAFRYAYSRIGNREDAEDIAIEAIQALPNPCRRRDTKLYVIGVVRRKVASYLRKRRIDVPLVEADSGYHDSDRSDFLNVWIVLAKLSDDHREALVLKYVVGLSSREIGTLLSKRSEAVDSLLQRARDAFAQNWISLSEEVTNERITG